MGDYNVTNVCTTFATNVFGALFGGRKENGSAVACHLMVVPVLLRHFQLLGVYSVPSHHVLTGVLQQGGNKICHLGLQLTIHQFLLPDFEGRI